MDNISRETESILKAIGKILKDIRLGKKIKQQTVADDLNIARAHLSKIENAKIQKYSIGTLIKLCAYYETSLSQVIEDSKKYSIYV